MIIINMEKEGDVIWYLLPILFGILGGLISFFMVRTEYPKLANRCVAVGLVSTAIGWGLFLLLQ